MTDWNATAPSGRPKVDLIVHELTPYRAHLIRRFAAEIPEMKFRVLLSAEVGGFAWRLPDLLPPEAVETLLVGQGHAVARQGKLRNFLKEWAKGGRLIRLISEHGTDAAVVFGYGDAAHRRVLRWCHARAIPSLLSADSNVRGDRAIGLKAFAKRRRVGAIVNQCSAVLPWGTLGAEYFRKYGAGAEKTFLVPHEPDYSLIEDIPPEDVRSARVRFGLDEGRRRVMFCGRLSPEKRIDLLLCAFAGLAPQRPDWDLLIVGDGPVGAQIRASVTPELANRIIFTGAITDPGGLAALYHCADVFVLPSDYEPWGIVVNEALAARLAVVCSTAVGAGADLVRDGVNGRIFNVECLKQLLASLLDATHPERLAPMKAAAGQILDEWRRQQDPVQGLRRALAAGGVL